METQVAVLKARFEDTLQEVKASTARMDALLAQLGQVNNKLTGFTVYYKVLFPTVTILVGVIGWLAGVKFF